MLPSTVLLGLWREERNHGSNCRGLVWGVGLAGGADKQSGGRGKRWEGREKDGLGCLSRVEGQGVLPAAGWIPPNSLRGLW